MPRKTNGLPFEVHRSPSTDDEGGVVLYATPLSNRTMEFDEIESYLILTNAVRKVNFNVPSMLSLTSAPNGSAKAIVYRHPWVFSLQSWE